MKKILIAVLIICGAVRGISGQEYRWVKGNTHAHTNNSDGNETPRRVMRWYQDYGYQFLMLTDHNMITETKALDSDQNDDFILIRGEEIGITFQKRHVHVCSFNPERPAVALPGATVAETLQNVIDASRLSGGLPQINHPQRRWSLEASDIKGLRNVCLFELLNLQRESNNIAAGGKPGMEELWDTLLTSGMVLYGVASDDSHEFLGDFSANKAHPGKGWVMVRVNELTPKAVCAALEKGDFYASTGVELTEVQITAHEYRLAIKPAYDAVFTTLFIGKDGKILSRVDGLNAAYVFKGDELYVRAKVLASTGELAFCQPTFIKK
jgi:predicted metal-dependent phosphoesterase TrpH